MKKHILKLITNIEDSLSRISKCHRFIKNLDKDSRNLLFFLLGTIYAFIVFFLSIYQIDLTPMVQRMMLFSIVLFVVSTSMTILPTSVKCTLTLIAFNFLASSGKILYTSIVFESIVKGPVGNTIGNIDRIFHSMKCQDRMLRTMGNSIGANDNITENILKQIRFVGLMGY